MLGMKLAFHCNIKIWENIHIFNSQVLSWFCRTNDPLICRYPVVNVVVSEKCFKGLPLKFCFRPFGDIHWNQKLDLKSAPHRKWRTDIRSCIIQLNGLNGIRNHLSISYRPDIVPIPQNQTYYNQNVENQLVSWHLNQHFWLISKLNMEVLAI